MNKNKKIKNLIVKKRKKQFFIVIKEMHASYFL